MSPLTRTQPIPYETYTQLDAAVSCYFEEGAYYANLQVEYESIEHALETYLGGAL